jgi:hypothetical protein
MLKTSLTYILAGGLVFCAFSRAHADNSGGTGTVNGLSTNGWDNTATLNGWENTGMLNGVGPNGVTINGTPEGVARFVIDRIELATAR